MAWERDVLQVLIFVSLHLTVREHRGVLVPCRVLRGIILGRIVVQGHRDQILSAHFSLELREFILNLFFLLGRFRLGFIWHANFRQRIYKVLSDLLSQLLVLEGPVLLSCDQVKYMCQDV